MRKKNCIVRRSTEGWDRASCSYVVSRPENNNRGRPGLFRFSKTSVSEAKLFTRGTACTVLKSLKRADPRRDESIYVVVEV